MTPLVDRFGRTITYLRVSVTDRCNLRCVYCLPAQGIALKSHDDMLTYEEIAAVAGAAGRMGIRRIRLTGGEPLVRRGVAHLVQMLKALPGIEEVSLTTNGVLLEEMAPTLAQAGLDRVNVSLDTLDPARYARLTRGGQVERAWRGIAAAEAAGLTPIKINVVAVRGLNDDELPTLARLTLEHAWHVRIIELMPVGDPQMWGEDLPDPQHAYLPLREIRTILEPLGMAEEKAAPGGGPARSFRLPGALGTVGLISPRGEHFCDRCNRLRLTADGFLRPCLLGEREVEVRGALRRGEPIEPLLAQAVSLKPEKHELASNKTPSNRWMAEIGG
jgi:cyclic pyranopterin phosphate synthase